MDKTPPSFVSCLACHTDPLLFPLDIPIAPHRIPPRTDESGVPYLYAIRSLLVN